MAKTYSTGAPMTDDSKRELLKKAAYIAPAILTFKTVPTYAQSGSGRAARAGETGNNGVGNGPDFQPPGNPPINDGPGTSPGSPGNRRSQSRLAQTAQEREEKFKEIKEKGNNGVGNGPDAEPPGNPKINDGPGTSPGNPGNNQQNKN
jgi:hypothetical protein